MSKPKHKLISLIQLANTIAYMRSLHGKKWLGKFQIAIEKNFRLLENDTKSFQKTADKLLAEFKEKKEKLDIEYCQEKPEKEMVQYTSKGIALFMVIAEVIYYPIYATINPSQQEEYANKLEELLKEYEKEMDQLKELLEEEVEINLKKVKEDFIPDDLDNEVISKILIMIN